jgi:5-methylcytosine-specific restriction endonuclease McrA
VIDIKDSFWDDIYKTRKNSRAEAFELVQDYYYRCRQRPLPENMWSSFYATTFGKYIHGHTSEFLAKAQDNFCVYCRERIFHKANANIEHILSRKNYPQYSFKLKNLALICVTCNAIKGATDYHAFDKDGTDYDGDAANLKCFHPQYHKFHDHINFFCMQTNVIYVRTYVGVSPEGMEFCQKHLSKITAYLSKAPGNPAGVAEIEKIGLLLASSNKPNDAAWDMLRTLIEKL